MMGDFLDIPPMKEVAETVAQLGFQFEEIFVVF
jgi:hypothetical protein